MGVAPKYIPLYFAPDQDPSWSVNPGVCTNLRNLVPTSHGTLASWISLSGERIAAFGATAQVSGDLVRTAAVLKRVNAATDRRYFFGTDNRLLEYQTAGSALTDVSRAAGGPYGATEWTFSAFGDVMLATCANPSASAQPTEFPQFSQGAAGTAFANLVTGTPPKARLGAVFQNFYVLFDVYDGVNWYQDGWACSGLGNIASWATTVANLTTGANNGRLLTTPGPIRAAIAQRDTLIIYKQDSMYVMTYTGNPYTFSTRLISNNIGQSSSGGVAVVNGVHYFIHRTGVYKFDGSYPQNIGNGMVNNFLAKLNPTASLLTSPGIKACVSEDLNLIVWILPTLESYGYAGLVNSALVYNYVTNQWGYVDKIYNDQSSTAGPSCPLVGTRSDLGSLAELPLYPFVIAGVNVAGSIIVRGVSINKDSQTLTSAGAPMCEVTLGSVGDEYSETRISRVKPRLLTSDGNLQSSTLTVDSKQSLGDYWVGQGLQINGTTSGAGAGTVLALIRSYQVADRPVLGGTEFMTFSLYPIAGSATTTVGIHVTFSDATTADFNSALTPTGAWQTVSLSMAAFSGKTITTVFAQIASSGGAGTQNFLIRDVKLTDSALTLIRRICFAGEERIVVTRDLTPAGVVTAATVEDMPSIGVSYAYDVARRRFDCGLVGRWLKPKMAFPNKTDLAGVYITTTPAGTE